MITSVSVREVSQVVTAREPLLAERENQESTSKKMGVGRESWCPRKSAKANVMERVDVASQRR